MPPSTLLHGLQTPPPIVHRRLLPKRGTPLTKLRVWFFRDFLVQIWFSGFWHNPTVCTRSLCRAWWWPERGSWSLGNGMHCVVEVRTLVYRAFVHIICTHDAGRHSLVSSDRHLAPPSPCLLPGYIACRGASKVFRRRACPPASSCARTSQPEHRRPHATLNLLVGGRPITAKAKSLPASNILRISSSTSNHTLPHRCRRTLSCASSAIVTLSLPCATLNLVNGLLFFSIRSIPSIFILFIICFETTTKYNSIISKYCF